MRRVVVFIIIVVSIQLFLVSCENNSEENEKKDFQFYYFPKKNVYYNVEKKNFLYSLNGGKTWDSLFNLSDAEPATLGEKVILYSEDDNVYKDNAAHRKMYNGTLYNIANADTALSSAGAEVMERKVQKKKIAGPKEEEEEVVKGLKKFLNKIFGKHGKKNEQ